ncbi:sugar ABC transporter ATP-binding protein [Arsenicitalea aurantiaca]|uniref:sugar ABC transporter ATP-binding protein n=1 Tax=Arsenicitalea aurantiaca TaxID=1783274 RepID=UPI00131595B0|nr:sugar ABC transporter ATP-binding protein [Arsenicitalea aurantiaca]
MTATASGPGPDAGIALLALSGLDKRYGATHALKAVSLALAAGEAVGLAGHNGAGKSTLIKCVAGAVLPDAGAIAVSGTQTRFSSPADAYAAGIRVIHQDAPLVPHFDTVENAFLGRPYPRRHGMVDRRAMTERVAEIARAIAPDLPLATPVALLTPSQRQFVRLIRALADDGRILILDEPTAALPAEDAARFFAVLGRVRDRGTAILLVSHRLDELSGFCDRTIVMADGGVVAECTGAGHTVAAIISAMGGGAPMAKVQRTLPDAPAILALEGARTRSLPVPIELEVRAGEIVVLYGLIGSGRSEVLDAIWGVERLTAGAMTLGGEPFAPRNPGEALDAGISYVPADRHRTGLFADESLVFNTTLPLLSRFRRWPRLPVPSRSAETRAFAEAARAVGLKFGHAGQKVRTLSGGNQQKLLFSRWASRHSRLILLDEPTEGVDVMAKAQLRDIVRAMAGDGNGVLVSTSDREEALELGDRVIVFSAGAIAAEFSRQTADAAALSTAAQSKPQFDPEPA